MERSSVAALILAAAMIAGIQCLPAQAGSHGVWGPPAHGYGKAWRPAYPPPNPWGWAPPQVIWIAKSVNMRGARFTGHGPDPRMAVNKALRKCRRNSVLPWTCYVLKLKKRLQRWGCAGP